MVCVAVPQFYSSPLCSPLTTNPSSNMHSTQSLLCLKSLKLKYDVPGTSSTGGKVITTRAAVENLRQTQSKDKGMLMMKVQYHE